MSALDPELLKALSNQLVSQLEQVKASLNGVTRGVAAIVSLAYDDPNAIDSEVEKELIDEGCQHPNLIRIATMNGRDQWLCGDCGESGLVEP
jgi:hypothetical protein